MFDQLGSGDVDHYRRDFFGQCGKIANVDCWGSSRIIIGRVFIGALA
jgi:hypothetical protein